MIIREATVYDFDAALNLFKKFHAEYLSKFNLEIVEENVYEFITKVYDQSVSFVMEKDGAIVGLVSGMVYPYEFNFSKKCFREIMWYVEPEYRGDGLFLLKALLKKLSDLKTDYIFMSLLECDNREQMEKIYTRFSLTPVEHAFMKVGKYDERT